MTVRVLAAGDRAWLLEVADRDEALGLYEDLRDRPVPGGVDLVPAARTVLVTFTTPALAGVAHADLIGRRARASRHAPGPLVELPVRYDGEDLDEVAALTGLSASEVVARHVAAAYVVAFIGFRPGFAYLQGLDPVLHVSRRDTPRTEVPAGSVGIAGEFSAVYPAVSPGGWRLLGRTDATLWDLDGDPPALLPPGTRVRFVPVTS